MPTMKLEWAPKPSIEASFAIPRLCVHDTEAELRKYVIWHTGGRMEINASIDVGDAKIYRQRGCLAWKCPIHNTIEELNLLELCKVGDKKVWHFKFHWHEQAQQPAGPPHRLILKFYPERGMRANDVVSLGTGFIQWNPETHTYVVRSAVAYLLSENLQNPSSKPELVVDIVVMDNAGNSRVFKMKYDSVTDKLECPYMDGMLLNEKELLEWVQNLLRSV